MSTRGDRVLRLSLVAVWMVTGVASLVEMNGQSRALLSQAGISNPEWLVIATIVGGACADIFLGIWIWARSGRLAYLTALVLMVSMTLVATLLQPSLWLHPLGPLLKNLPIAAVLLHLLQAEQSKLTA